MTVVIGGSGVAFCGGGAPPLFRWGRGVGVGVGVGAGVGEGVAAASTEAVGSQGVGGAPGCSAAPARVAWLDGGAEWGTETAGFVVDRVCDVVVDVQNGATGAGWSRQCCWWLKFERHWPCALPVPGQVPGGAGAAATLAALMSTRTPTDAAASATNAARPLR